MKFLCYGESHTISTGTSQLSKHILPILTELGHDIELVAINHFEGDHIGKEYPFKIHVSPNNEAYNLEKAKELIRQGDYDALFLSSDVGQLNALTDTIRDVRHRRGIPVVMYSCVDTDIINAQTLACLTAADYPIVYSQHSKRIAQRYLPALNIQVISPGCEPDIFFPLPEDQRRQWRKNIFGIDDDFFLVINVNRNQWRKDPVRSLMVFQEFHKTHPNSAIYMHMKMQDIGGSLPGAAQIIGMGLINPGAEVVFTGPKFNEQEGVPREILNNIYNCADVMISTSTGEGWGLTTTEAMAAGCPLIVPRNTSFVEIIGEHEERGYLVESGGDIDHLAVPYGISDNPRAIVHAYHMIHRMDHVYNHRDDAKEKAAAAREWALEHTWEHSKEQWRELFMAIEQARTADKSLVR